GTRGYGRPADGATARPGPLRDRGPNRRPRRAPHGKYHGLGHLPPVGPPEKMPNGEEEGRPGRYAVIESPSVVLQYQRALESFRRQGGGRDPLLKRMSELISLLDFTTTLSSSLSGDEILEAALLMVMGELQASRGCLLVRSGDDRYRVRVARGLAEAAPREVALPSVLDPELLSRHPAAAEAFDR